MCIRLDKMKRDRRFVVIAGNSKRRITRLASQTRMQPAASINVNANGRTDGRTDAIAMAIANADARKNRLTFAAVIVIQHCAVEPLRRLGALISPS